MYIPTTTRNNTRTQRRHRRKRRKEAGCRIEAFQIYLSDDDVYLREILVNSDIRIVHKNTQLRKHYHVRKCTWEYVCENGGGVKKGKDQSIKT